MNFLYKNFLKPILFLFHPDFVHEYFIAFGEFAGRFTILKFALRIFFGYRGASISKVVDGITYKTPVLLSAGFDSDGRLTQVLKHISLGGEEIGSITALPCEGNPRPYMTRLIRNCSLVVYKGLKNAGVDVLIARLQKMKNDTEFVVGISIARTNTKSSCVDTASGIADYTTSFKKLNDTTTGDYYTINISCPNTFLGETFTSPQLLSQLLTSLATIKTEKPVYLKMPINQPWDQFSQLLQVADSFPFVRGVIIGNLNKDYSELDFPADAPPQFRGGLSGKPCFKRSNELIRQTRETYKNRFTIIGCGGVLTPDDAMEKFNAGADLIQIISGLVFSGPGLPKAICERYEKRIHGE